MDQPRILVADDSATLRRIVAGVLESAGYRVDIACDGVECVQKFYADRPDLLLCDITMPKLSGYLVCRLVKEDWSAAHVPVIMLTSRDTAGDRFWASKSGAERYLTKDFGPEDLLSAVGGLIANRQPSFMAPVSAPQHLSEGSVLSRVCELLDRKLFEQTLVNELGEIAARTSDFAERADAALGVLGHVLGYTLGAIALTEERLVAVRPVGVVARQNVANLVHALDDALRNTPGVLPADEELAIVTFDAGGSIVEDAPGSLATFVSMPLQSGGRVIGVLGLASTQPNAFGEGDLATLRVVEQTLATIIDNARLAERVARSAAYGVR